MIPMTLTKQKTKAWEEMILLSGGLLLFACGKGPDSFDLSPLPAMDMGSSQDLRGAEQDLQTLKEYVLVERDLEGYLAWPQTAQPRAGAGPDAAFLGGRHNSMDAKLLRSMHIRNVPLPSMIQRDKGLFPIGVVVMKVYTNLENNTIVGGTAMAKRGNGFDPLHGDWEWFILDASLKIRKDMMGNPMRGTGAQVGAGSCTACHAAAKDKDLVFTLP